MRARPFAIPLVLVITAGVAGFLAGQRFPAQTTAESGPERDKVITAITGGTGGAPVAAGDRGAGLDRETGPGRAGSPREGRPSKQLLETLEELVRERKEEDVERLLATWLARDPEEVLRFLESSPRRDELLRQATKTWAESDRTAASDWLTAHPGVPGRDAMAAGLAGVVVEKNPESGVRWVASIKDPLQKLAGAKGAGYEFFRHNDEAALAALEKMGLPASSIEPELREAWQSQLKNMVRRHSQNIASAHAAAMAAGATSSATTVEEAINEVTSGLTGSGQFSTSVFKVHLYNLTERERAAVGSNLDFSDGSLFYTTGSGDL